MSSNEKELSLEERRARLERRANVIRSRLLRTIDKLDGRRKQVAAITHEAKELAMPVTVSVASLAAAAVGIALAVRAVTRHRREQRAVSPLQQMLARYTQPPRPSFLSELARRAALTLVGIAVAEGARRGLHALQLSEAEKSPL